MCLKKISITLPTYNEAPNVIPLITELEKQLNLKKYDYEIIVVDDNSQDMTWKIIEEYETLSKHVRLINRKSERGLTSAINKGIVSSSGNIIVWLDGDFSHPPNIINQLISGINNHTDAVIASRYVPGGQDIRDGKYKFQKFLSLFLSVLSRIFLRIPVRDITSGYIAIKKECFDTIGLLNGDYGEYFIDLLCRLKKAGYNMTEIPYSLVNRQYGESKTATTVFGYAQRGIKYIAMIFKYSI